MYSLLLLISSFLIANGRSSSNCSVVRDVNNEYNVDCSNSNGNFQLADFQNIPVVYLNVRNASLNSSVNFSKWTNVKYVDMSYNNLTSVDRKSFIFQGIRQLVQLNLSYCELNELSGLLKADLLVRLVDLSGNNKLFKSENFWTVLNQTLLGGTESLHMSNMNLRSIPENAFASSVNLTYLRIRDNFLRNLPKFPSTLIQLDVSNNSLNILTYNPFALTRNLTFFVADDNSNLTRIEENAFDAMDNVVEISLRNNRRLSFLPKDAFSRNYRLRRLTLADCNLNTLSFFLEPRFIALNFLNLTGNPLECDESNRWLTEMSDKILDLSQMRCANDGDLMVDHFGGVNRVALKTLAMIGGTMTISFLFIGFWFAYDLEMKRRSANPYWRLGKNKPNPTAVYVSTTVV